MRVLVMEGRGLCGVDMVLTIDEAGSLDRFGTISCSHYSCGVMKEFISSTSLHHLLFPPSTTLSSPSFLPTYTNLLSCQPPIVTTAKLHSQTHGKVTALLAVRHRSKNATTKAAVGGCLHRTHLNDPVLSMGEEKHPKNIINS